MSKMRDADMPLVERIGAAIERIAHGQAAMLSDDAVSEYRNRRAAPDELEPCPFCGSTDIANVSAHAAGPTYRWHAGDTIFAVNCRGCGACVPSRYRNDLVVEAWNRRTQSGEVAAINDAKEQR